jgi:hypothetical protein
LARSGLATHPTGIDARLRVLDAVDGNVAWASGSKGTVLRTIGGGELSAGMCKYVVFCDKMTL